MTKAGATNQVEENARYWLAGAACLIGVGLSGPVAAASSWTPQEVTIATAVQQSWLRYGVPRALIYAIMRREGGGPGVMHKNPNGTWDLGRMQINTSWLPQLAQYGITRQALLWSDAVNIEVGTWILALCHQQTHSWRETPACYNAGSMRTKAAWLAGQRYAYAVVSDWDHLYRLGY